MKLTYAEIAAVMAEEKSIDKFLEKLGNYHFMAKHDDDIIPGLAHEANRWREKVLGDALSLERRLQQVRREITREISHLDGEFLPSAGLNSLGELQGSAPDFDIKVAVYCYAFERFKEALYSRRHEKNRRQQGEMFSKILADPMKDTLLELLLKRGDSTVKQLVASSSFFTRSEDSVRTLLDELVVCKAVKQVGHKHYRVTGEMAKVMHARNK